MGMALARRLAAGGHTVSVFERDLQTGGLSTHQDYGPFTWDRFYHVVLPTDLDLARFLEQLSPALAPKWVKTLTGFFVDRRLYSISSSMEFLKFPPLSLTGKIRLALTILYCARISDWRKLERTPVTDWLLRTSGKSTYEKMWKPLLLAKLGDNYKRVSAVFIWSYIKRMASARSSASRKEQLGYIPGGYKAVFNQLEREITANGGDVRTGVSVTDISPSESGGLTLTHDGAVAREHFDKVIFTSPVSVLGKVAANGLVNMLKDGRQVEYLGVICMTLVTRSPVVPYYIVNIADSRIPFTGIIGMSNLVAGTETAGRHLTYLPKYVHAGDPIMDAPEEELRTQFLEGLRLMLPGFDTADIESVRIHRARRVQPLQVIDYSKLVPDVRTAHPDFYVLNTSQFVNSTLNNNEVIRLVNGFLQDHAADFGLTGFRHSPDNPDNPDNH